MATPGDPSDDAARAGRVRAPFLAGLLPRTAVRREGMIENRPALTFITHAVLWIGVAIVAFPVYVTFVASTLTAEEILAAPMPLVPGAAPGRQLHRGVDQRRRQLGRAGVGR